MTTQISELMQAGHKLRDIMGYSLRQIDGLLRLVETSKNRDDKALAILIRMSYHADGKGFKGFLKQLEG